MQCPKCTLDGLVKVVKTVNVPGNEVYRRKRCEACGHTFHTVEFEVEVDKRFKREWATYAKRPFNSDW